MIFLVSPSVTLAWRLSHWDKKVHLAIHNIQFKQEILCLHYKSLQRNTFFIPANFHWSLGNPASKLYFFSFFLSTFIQEKKDKEMQMPTPNMQGVSHKVTNQQKDDHNKNTTQQDDQMSRVSNQRSNSTKFTLDQKMKMKG